MKLLRHKDRGFVATLMAMSMLVILSLGGLGAFAAASAYDDGVLRREYRMQADLNARSCVQMAILGFAHDYFYAPDHEAVQDFSCSIISASRNGRNISVITEGYDHGASIQRYATLQDTGRSVTLVSE